jgi:hypothetical protein
MKKIARVGWIVLLAPLLCAAQARVEAGAVLEKVNRGEPVRYEKARIVGDLMLIALDDMTVKHPRGQATTWEKVRESRRGWGFSTRTYWAHVKSPVVFVDCVFEGDVVAYRHDDRRRETYNVIFHRDVVFQDCEFKGESAFKYCRFEDEADFAGNRYSEEALFKYADFSSEVSFAGSGFAGYANFKYAEFPEAADFGRSEFHKDANFKYTKFDRGSSFAGAVFRRYADFKYTKFRGPMNFEGTDFEWGGNFKYTRHDGRRFSPLAGDERRR